MDGGRTSKATPEGEGVDQAVPDGEGHQGDVEDGILAALAQTDLAPAQWPPCWVPDL